MAKTETTTLYSNAQSVPLILIPRAGCRRNPPAPCVEGGNDGLHGDGARGLDKEMASASREWRCGQLPEGESIDGEDREMGRWEDCCAGYLFGLIAQGWNTVVASRVECWAPRNRQDGKDHG